MAVTYSGRLKASVEWNDSDAQTLKTVQDASNLAFDQALGNGAGANNFAVQFEEERTIAAGGNYSYDLTALVGTFFGGNITKVLALLKVLLIKNKNTVAGDKLTIDTSVTNHLTAPWEDSITSKQRIAPGSPLVLASLADGFTVDATHKVLKLSNPSAHDITFGIVLLGN